MNFEDIDEGYIRSLPEYDGHMKVVKLMSKRTGLIGFISLHKFSKKKPSIGGTRYFNYSNLEEGIRDSLRLSRSMSYKCVVAGIPFYGGKCVLIKTVKEKNSLFLSDYAKCINKLNKLRSLFYTGEDVGMTEKDVQYLSNFSNYFIGRTGKAGDPSPFAALSTYTIMEHVCKKKYGIKNMSGISVAIKGVGKVGSELLKLLVKHGVLVSIADINYERVRLMKDMFPNIQVVAVDEINKLKCQVYAPCAMGNEFTEKNVDTINADIVCGSANNQIFNSKVGDMLDRRGVLYIPDYVSNSGGLINVADELNKFGYNQNRVKIKINKLCNFIEKMFGIASDMNVPLYRATDSYVEKVLSGYMS